jgi:nicotinamide-nucleotide amidase
MPGELITVGDELLSGRTVNNNAAHIGHHLRSTGFELRWVTVVGDQEDDISAALIQALDRATFLVVTGGLGPTDDDRTNAAIAEALGRPLCRDPLSWNIITTHLRKLDISMTPTIAKMADIPEGAKRIDLLRPRAGYYIGDAEKPIFCLPGVPDEMAYMLAEFVIPTLRERFPEQKNIRPRQLRIFGLRESEMGHRLIDLKTEYPTVRVGYFPSFPENHLTLTVQTSTAAAADTILEAAVQAVVARLGLYVYGEGDDTLAMVVGRLLLERGQTLALAESCTGGLIAHLITNVPGSSTYFDQSMVTYSETAKVLHLSVPPELIAQHGVVSAQVAEAMVRGLQRENKNRVLLAVTGLVGPTDGSPGKPIGTVFIALLYDKHFRVEGLQLRGERQEIKLAAAYTALDWLRRAMIDDAFFAGG